MNKVQMSYLFDCRYSYSLSCNKNDIYVAGTMSRRMVLWVWICYSEFYKYMAVINRSSPRITNDACQCFEV